MNEAIPKEQVTLGEGFAFAAWFRARCERYRFSRNCGGWECQGCRSEYLDLILEQPPCLI